jgi:hypothetical protein
VLERDTALAQYRDLVGGTNIFGKACNDSSQQASPAPRSDVDCHHELRGVMTTTGLREEFLPG